MFASRRFLTRKRLIGIAVALVLGCAAFVYGIRRLELLITFHPDRMTVQEGKSPAEGAEIV